MCVDLRIIVIPAADSIRRRASETKMSAYTHFEERNDKNERERERRKLIRKWKKIDVHYITCKFIASYLYKKRSSTQLYDSCVRRRCG